MFNETIADMPRATLSSGSIPGAFPPQPWPEFDVTCIDGGTLWNNNFMSAIQRCREIVDNDSDIIVDMVGPFELTLGNWTHTHNALSNHLRHQSIKKFSTHHDQLREFLSAFPDIDFRYLVYPSTPLDFGLNVINFDNATNTWPTQMLGRQDAIDAMKAGPGVAFDQYRID